MKTSNVMVIEDDFRITNIHKEMIESNDNCKVINSSRTSAEALTYLNKSSSSVDVILLDIYIPDVSGLELLKKIKQTYPFISVIVASAANDPETFISAKCLGVFDYLIKPIEIERLKLAFERFNNLVNFKKSELTQKDIDSLLWSSFHSRESQTTDLPKGIDSLTLGEIQSFFNASLEKEVTAQALAELLGISRATARRYLEYLVGIEWLDASLNYGQVGRPQRIYTFREHNELN